MNIDAEKLNAVAQSLARGINGFCCKSEVTVGEVDGVVQGRVITESDHVVWCSIGQEWVS